MNLRVGDVVYHKADRGTKYIITSMEIELGIPFIKTVCRWSKEEGRVGANIWGRWEEKFFTLVAPMTTLTQKEKLYTKIAFLEEKRKIKLATTSSQVDAQRVLNQEETEQVITSLSIRTGISTAMLAPITERETNSLSTEQILQEFFRQVGMDLGLHRVTTSTEEEDYF